jgi:hypothetical protein
MKKIRIIQLLALVLGVALLAVLTKPESARGDSANYLDAAPDVIITLDQRYAEDLYEAGGGDFLLEGQSFSAQFIGWESGYAVLSLGSTQRLLYIKSNRILMMEVAPR